MTEAEATQSYSKVKKQKVTWRREQKAVSSYK